MMNKIIVGVLMTASFVAGMTLGPRRAKASDNITKVYVTVVPRPTNNSPYTNLGNTVAGAQIVGFSCTDTECVVLAK
jgi:hypothetical protein